MFRCCEFGREDDGAQHLGNLVRLVHGLEPHAGHALDEGIGRGVADKAAAKFGRKVDRRAWVGRDKIEHLVAVRHGRCVGVELSAEDAFLVIVVPAVIIDEFTRLRKFVAVAGAAAILHRPAGEGARGFVDVLVDIADGFAFDRARHFAPAIVDVVVIMAGP